MQRLIEMMDNLKGNPSILVFESIVEEPLPSTEVEAKLAIFGQASNTQLREFLMANNGISLWWMHKRNPLIEKGGIDRFEKFFKKNGFYDEELMTRCDGFISISGIPFLLDPTFSDNVLDTIPDSAKKEEFRGKIQSSAEIRSRLRDFDYFSNTEDGVLLSVEDPTSPYLILATSNFLNINESRYVSLESYLEFLIWSKGLKNARYDFFKQPENYNNQVELLEKAYFDALPSIEIDNLY